MTIPEQAGKVVGAVVEGLKTSPALLVLVLLQVFMFVVLYYAAEHNNDRRQEREMLLLRSCLASIPSENRR